MAKKPFKVSARTARLIGRENVSNAEGAIIELVKNCYDADSPTCVLFFDINYEAIPEKLSSTDYLAFLKETTKTINRKKHSVISDAYSYVEADEDYRLAGKLATDTVEKLEKYFKSKNKVFIIDCGDGMTEDIIDKHWMTIGTNNKLMNVFTTSGRVKAGAKGIGRFALDRLGSLCHMITSPKSKSIVYDWKVNWEDFELEDANISEINADFGVRNGKNYKKEIFDLVKDEKVKASINQDENDFKSGTTLEIGSLRDWWTFEALESLYKSLQILSPPANKQKFNIELLSKQYVDQFGKVDNEEYTDYDYKVFAKIFKDKSVKITIYRDEFQTNKIDRDLFRRNQMKADPYNYETFLKGSYTINSSIDDLLPWLAESSMAEESDSLKDFDFTFYFMKLSSNESDKRRFFYKNFNRNERLDWFSKFGGIKIFRDNFRVRPYGEPGNTSFDWLLLGDRQAKSPAGISKKGGGWRVAPNQVAGVVNISRLANLKFEDKSSREGFQENNTFFVFQQLLLAIISQFEQDRHTVMREMDLLFREKNEEEEAKRKAEELIADDDSSKSENLSEAQREQILKQERDTFRKAYSAVKASLEDSEEEVRILSALATTGLIVTSFAHEFSSYKLKLVRNTNYLYSELTKLLNKKKLDATLLSRNNPFNHIDNLKKAHEGIIQWLDLSLTAIKKDKRVIKPISLTEYLEEFQEIWNDVLLTRKTQLKIDIQSESKLKIKAYQIDIDSIFNNLLINSFDAFDRKGFTGKRFVEIDIKTGYNDEDAREYIYIIYTDSGPGLSKKIKNPYQILRRGYTTKVNDKNVEIGTGLGMWIINETVSYYGGTIEILTPQTGFHIALKIPLNKQ
jgi:signal transduction histidine kinase